MGVEWRKPECHRRKRSLQREARIPIPVARRPCLLVGLSLVVVLLVATLDAFLWHQSAQRDAVRAHAESMEARAHDMRVQRDQARQQQHLAEIELQQLRDAVERHAQRERRSAGHPPLLSY